MRCNAGINPEYLLDQHLIAEYREIPMLFGMCEYHKWEIKSEIPKKFNLGKGYINFLKNKLFYLQKRHIEIKKELSNRNIACELLNVNLDKCPNIFCNDWQPNLNDSLIIRNRIIERIKFNKKSFSWWRYYHKNMKNNTQDQYFNILLRSELFYV